MPSPRFRINGGAVGVKASVSPGASVTATLDSTDGVRAVSWSIIGTDETTEAADYTLVQSGSVGQTVTFTAGTAGTAGILRAEINGGINLQTEQADETTRATGKWYVKTAEGLEVGCVNEQMESSSTHGWTGIINAGLRTIGDAAVETIANVQAITSPMNGRIVWCAEVDAAYKFDTSSATAANSWTVLIANDGTTGRWLLVGDRISLAPIGGGANDWERLAEAAAACAYKAAIHLRPGAWVCNTVESFPSGTTIVGSADVSIVASLTPSVEVLPLNNVFFAAPPDPTVTTGLAVNAVPGTDTIQVDDATGFDVGFEIILFEDNNAALYTITAIDGDEFTLDRPVVHPFTTDAEVFDHPFQRDIRIIGNGMRISGTGDSAVMISSGVNCLIEGLRVTGFSVICVAYDGGSRLCQIRNCDFDGDNTVLQCFTIESLEDSIVENIRCVKATSRGAGISGGWGNVITGVHCWENAGGGMVVTAGSPGNDSQAVTISGCTFYENGGAGMEIVNGVQKLAVVGCQSRQNSGAGFIVNTGTCHDIHFSGCDSEGDTVGFWVAAGSRGITIEGCSANSATQYGIHCEGQTRVSNFYSSGCVQYGALVASAGEFDLVGARIVAPATGDFNGILQTGTSRVTVSHVTADLTGSGTRIFIWNAGTGITACSDVRTIAGTLGLFITAGGVLVRGQRVDMSSVSSTQVTVSGGSTEGQSQHGLFISSSGTTKRIETNATGIGFFGVTPVARPAAYTQTYATAARTVTAPVGQDNAQVGAVYARLSDVQMLAQALNSVIDDLQAFGLLQ